MNPSDIYPSPHFSFRPLVLTIAFLFAGMNSAAAAEDSTTKATYIDTQPIVVTATRTTQPLYQAASSLSVLTEQDIQEDQPVTLGGRMTSITPTTVPKSVFSSPRSTTVSFSFSVFKDTSR